MERLFIVGAGLIAGWLLIQWVSSPPREEPLFDCHMRQGETYCRRADGGEFHMWLDGGEG